MMGKHEVGNIYELEGNKYKLVKGSNCNDCILLANTRLCKEMPPCEQHDGHYIKIEPSEEKLNIPVVGNMLSVEQQELFNNYCNKYFEKPYRDNVYKYKRQNKLITEKELLKKFKKAYNIST